MEQKILQEQIAYTEYKFPDFFERKLIISRAYYFPRGLNTAPNCFGSLAERRP